MSDSPPADVLPSHAESFEMVVERRIKDLLNLAVEPKDLTAAIKAATEWHEVRKKYAIDSGWGSALPKNGTLRDG